MILLFSLIPAFSSDLELIYKRYDLDQDKKITIDDKLPANATYRWNGKLVQGTYFLSNLAQELKFKELTGEEISPQTVFENPVDRISRLIKERYWDGLTRRIDVDTLEKVIKDPKLSSQKYYLYIPSNDREGLIHYKNLKQKDVIVSKLPSKIPPDKHGLLALAIKDGKGVPYVVPGGRFNEMYGWDSYFHTLGVLADGRIDLAKGMVDNFVYEITHYGKILNANRTYYLTRSQPPFLTSMIRSVHEVLPKNNETQKWLADSLRAAIKEYKTVWMGEERLTTTGLSRYAGLAEGIPPEVEPGHFDHVLRQYALKHKMSIGELMSAFSAGKIKDKKLTYFFHQDRAVRESGHDTTYRWRVKGEDRALDFVTVDLNSLLYKYESDLTHIIKTSFANKFEGFTAEEFSKAAKSRKDLMMKYLWDAKKKTFYDYNWRDKTRSNYLSATAFYPLWAKLVSKNDAASMVRAILPKLEHRGGISATSEESLKAIGDLKFERQWEFPNGWAPHQILIWEGLHHYGLAKDANRLIYKWLYMITRNAMDYNGTIPEKYNVVSMSHKVFAEYGNVGTTFSYITLEGFGWMNASFQLGLQKLPPKYKDQLKKLISPENLVP